MNEKGLVVNALYLAESQYDEREDQRPTLLIALWGQYALDNFANVTGKASILLPPPPHRITTTSATITTITFE